MSEQLTLTWSFRNRVDIFIDSIRSADATCSKDINFCLVDAASSEDTIRKLRTFCNSISDRKIRICESAYKTTWQEAINVGIMLSDTRYVLFTSSDCIFKNKGWGEIFLQAFSEGSQYVIVGNHALFGIDKKLISKIGWFDERFQYGPLIDVDYMIRASEAGVICKTLSNNGYYVHGDEMDVTFNMRRRKESFPDRLPFNNFTDEKIFKEKWETSWPGEEEYVKRGEFPVHPPTNIRQVKRKLQEVDPHPFYTEKYRKLQ